MAWNHNKKPSWFRKYAVSPILTAGKIFLIQSEKIQAVMRMKADSNKVICSDFDREFLYDYRYEHDDLPLFDQSMNLHTFQLQELPCLSLVLLHLGFVIHLIKSACTSLLFTKLDPILCKDRIKFGKEEAGTSAFN